MISQFRRYTDSWIARVFFVIMAISFVGWGISGDIFSLLGPPSWVAKIGGQTIEVSAFQTEFQRALAQQSRNLPAGQEPPAGLRLRVGQETLERMIAQAALGLELKDLRVVTPDDALVAVVRSMPAFQGSDGKFSRGLLDTVLRSNGYTEARFMAQLRSDISQRQLMSVVSGAAAASDVEIKPLYEAEFEKRAADVARFPLTEAAEPAEPEQAALERWYDNHRSSYATPEFRRIKAIELSPQSLGSDIAVTDEELRTAYDEHKADYVAPEKRSAEVISAPDGAKARTLADRWRGGSDWTAMQAAAKDEGAAAITQDDATEVQFADPDLSKAVFTTPANTVSEPIKGQIGWFVVKVTKVAPGSVTSFDQAKEALRSQILAAKAADIMYDRANKLDQLLGNGTTLDNLPGDLGVIGVAGTLDQNGMTADGEPAPLPGPPELKSAIISAAFQARQGDPPQLTEVQMKSTGGSAYYALSVENVIPPGEKPFEAVRDQVEADWKQDQRRRFQDRAATAMMTAVQDGKSFSDAATVAGVVPKLSELVTRNQAAPDMPAELQRVLFGMKQNETTMVETPEGFVVGQLTEIVKPDAATDKAGYAQARTAIDRSIVNDMTTLFVDALRRRASAQTNQQAFESVVQPR